MRELLGGKGANLAEMSSIGLPVPPGFTLSTESVTWFYDHDHSYPETSRRRWTRYRQARKSHGLTLPALKTAPVIGAVRVTRINAGDDGYGAQSRHQQRRGAGLAEIGG